MTDQLKSESMAVVRISGQAAEASAVPAEVLIRTLSGLQQLVYIVASDSQSKKYAQRFRVTDDIERDYRLMCQVPQAGSYVMPVSFQPSAEQLSLLPSIQDGVFGKLDAFFDALSQAQLANLTGLFSDPCYAKRALKEVRKFLPKADDSWNFGFRSSGSTREVVLTKDSVKAIDDWINRESPAESTTTVTGELIRIDFDERKLFLRYPPTLREIECIYADDLEDVMIENRRELIQVTGRFTLDANGHPIKLSDVSRIEPLNLSPIILSEVTYNNRRFHFNKVLYLTPVLEDEDKQLLIVEDSRLGLSTYAHTREELLEGIAAYIAHLWDEYAVCADNMMTPEAQQLKLAILESVVLRDAA
jgi:hypothetical protein